MQKCDYLTVVNNKNFHYFTIFCFTIMTNMMLPNLNGFNESFIT